MSFRFSTTFFISSCSRAQKGHSGSVITITLFLAFLSPSTKAFFREIWDTSIFLLSCNILYCSLVLSAPVDTSTILHYIVLRERYVKNSALALRINRNLPQTFDRAVADIKHFGIGHLQFFHDVACFRLSERVTLIAFPVTAPCTKRKSVASVDETEDNEKD